MLSLAYSLKADFVINVGQIGDAPFVSGFNADEAGSPRFRWTAASPSNKEVAEGVVIFPTAPASPARLSLLLGGPPADIYKKLATPILVTVLVNDKPVGTTQIEDENSKQINFDVPQNIPGDKVKVEIRSAVLKVAGDSRTLGIRVQKVELQGSASLQIPAWDVLVWAWIYILAIFLIVQRSISRLKGEYFKSVIVGLLATLPWLLLPLVLPNLWYTPYLLPLVSLSATVLAMIVWRREISSTLLSYPAHLEISNNLGKTVLIIATLTYFIFGLVIVSKIDWIGHADYADNGVVARNLVQGNGFSVDYAAQFYQFYPHLPHPADTWPLLQPLITAPFFLIFGATAFTAKLPNLFLMIGLTWAVYYYVCRYFNRKTALGAALITLASPAFLETVAYPINDLAFTLFMWLSIFSFYTALTYIPIAGAALDNPSRTTIPKVSVSKRVFSWLWHPGRRLWLISGVWGGLLFLCKPSGAVILIALGLAVLASKLLSNKKLMLSWKNIFLWALMILLLVSPYFIRNEIAFGKPLYSTENYDTWINKWAQNDESIYNLYYPNNSALPGPSLLLTYGYDSDFKEIGLQFSHQIDDLLQGKFEAPLILILAILGIVVMPQRRMGLIKLVGWVFVCYELFINLYWHYEPRYFLAWRPWIFTFGIFGLSWLYAKIKEQTLDSTNNSSAYSKLGAWAVTGTFLLLFWPNLNQTISDGIADTNPTGIVITSNWIKNNNDIPVDAVIMSRNVWELSFHSERHSVMIPNNASLAAVEQVMTDYNSRYIELDHLDTTNSIWRQRKALWPLVTGQGLTHFNKIYDQNGFLIYKWDGKF